MSVYRRDWRNCEFLAVVCEHCRRVGLANFNISEGHRANTETVQYIHSAVLAPDESLVLRRNSRIRQSDPHFYCAHTLSKTHNYANHAYRQTWLSRIPTTPQNIHTQHSNNYAGNHYQRWPTLHTRPQTAVIHYWQTPLHLQVATLLRPSGHNTHQWLTCHV